MTDSEGNLRSLSGRGRELLRHGRSLHGRPQRGVARQVHRERGVRDRTVLATKFTFNGEQGNPNAGGNGRKNIYRALEGSLKRLGTDYVDLYWMHAWDTVTPIEEVLRHVRRSRARGKNPLRRIFRRAGLVCRARADPGGKGGQDTGSSRCNWSTR